MSLNVRAKAPLKERRWLQKDFISTAGQFVFCGEGIWLNMGDDQYGKQKVWMEIYF